MYYFLVALSESQVMGISAMCTGGDSRVTRAFMYAGPSAEELDEQEMTFLEDIYQLMQAAHFRLLSADDWKTAQAEQFTVSCPVSYPHRHLSPG